jgi:hypothetical protein
MTNIFNFLSSIKELIIGGLTLIVGLFFTKKYVDQKDEIIELQNENNNLKAEKQKTEVEKENQEVEIIRLKDEIQIKEFESNISEPAAEKIEDDVQKEIEKNLEKNIYKIKL